MIDRPGNDAGRFFWSGRFLSADTIIASFGNPQSLNRYSYGYNNPINSTDPTGHKVCDEQWGCNGEGRPPSTTPGKGDTDTNTPGGSNTPADQANSAEDTSGDDKGGGSSPDALPRPDIFIGSPQDVAEAWDLLETAAGYGPNTRRLIAARINPLMRIVIVRDNANVNVTAGYDANPFIIDIGDIEKFPDVLNNPLPPANVLAHEFVEQYEIQVRGADYPPAHGVGIGTENVANVERTGNYMSTPIRTVGHFNSGVFEDNVLKSVTINYWIHGPEVGGRTQANVTMNYTYPGGNSMFSVNVQWVRP